MAIPAFFRFIAVWYGQPILIVLRKQYTLLCSLWTSRFLVLNILVRRDLVSAESIQRSTPAGSSSTVFAVNFFVFDAYRHIERTKKVNQFCKKLLNSWVMKGFSEVWLLEFVSVLSLLNLGQFKEKRNKKHFIFYIKLLLLLLLLSSSLLWLLWLLLLS